MKKLMRNFKKLNFEDKIKFIFICPLYCASAIIEDVIELFVLILRWALRVLINDRKELVVLTIIVSVVIAVIKMTM